MKIKSIPFLLLFFLLVACKNTIKNENATIMVEEGAQIGSTKIENQSNLLGNYVGLFEADYPNDKTEQQLTAQEKAIEAGESFRWYRENKISLFINEIKDTIIKGYSVVAGNERLFEGTITKKDTVYQVMAKEQGTNKNDGIFIFTIKDTLIEGKWKSFAKIDIENRKYALVKKEFSYNPNVMLDTTKYGYHSNRYVDWTKPSMTKEAIKALKATMTKQEREEYEEFEEYTDFASATENIYRINSSTTLLKEDRVANMRRGDICILRNTIYARHGYSFKYAPLRVFFDKQSWYIPASTNIKDKFTEIEKQNIQLLLRYEKFAKEYYDSFGRG